MLLAEKYENNILFLFMKNNHVDSTLNKLVQISLDIYTLSYDFHQQIFYQINTSITFKTT